MVGKIFFAVAQKKRHAKHMNVYAIPIKIFCTIFFTSAYEINKMIPEVSFCTVSIRGYQANFSTCTYFGNRKPSHGACGGLMVPDFDLYAYACGFDSGLGHYS